MILYQLKVYSTAIVTIVITLFCRMCSQRCSDVSCFGSDSDDAEKEGGIPQGLRLGRLHFLVKKVILCRVILRHTVNFVL